MRPALLAFAALTTLTLVACGETTDTLLVTGPDGSLSLVIAGSTGTIASFENQASGVIAGGGYPGHLAWRTSGDQHESSLPQLCDADVTDNGAQYQVTIYTDIPSFTSATCSSFNKP
jgi:hypothetical protein